ncbi:MAG: hypothetical protein RID07_16040, partial [Lacipirellulaceae bacterium]
MTLVALDLSATRFEDSHFTPSPAANFADAVRFLNEGDRRALRKASGVAYEKKAGFDAVLGALVVELLSEKIDKENVGIFFCGTQAHLATAHEFALRAITRGTSLIDPLQFPATLPSYAPTAIAAVHQCHGPALTVGHGAKSHLDAVHIARSYLHARIISQAIVIFTSADKILTTGSAAYALAKFADVSTFECEDMSNGVQQITERSKTS